LFTIREAGMQVPTVTMSRPSLRAVAAPPFTTWYKRLAEGRRKALAFGFWAFGLLAFWMWEAFEREGCWREIAEVGK
jgi:hypothetical protein